MVVVAEPVLPHPGVQLLHVAVHLLHGGNHREPARNALPERAALGNNGVNGVEHAGAMGVLHLNLRGKRHGKVLAVPVPRVELSRSGVYLQDGRNGVVLVRIAGAVAQLGLHQRRQPAPLNGGVLHPRLLAATRGYNAF